MNHRGPSHIVPDIGKATRAFTGVWVVAFLLIIFSCKPSVPRHIIQPQQMEDILYDCHLADAMAALRYDSTANYNARLYRLAVYKKHHVTEAEFDSAMVYYTRHADRLHAIYENLARRMNDDAIALGAQVPPSGAIAVNARDTADIWNIQRDVLLTPQAPYNRIGIYLEADTSYHRGDRFTLSFDTKFVYQEGLRDAIAHVAVRYQNDSIITRFIRINADNHYSLDVNNPDSLGIKNIRAFFIMLNDSRRTETTLKMMAVRNISLVRCHPQSQKAQSNNENQGASTVSAIDQGVSTSREITSPPVPKNVQPSAPMLQNDAPSAPTPSSRPTPTSATPTPSSRPAPPSATPKPSSRPAPPPTRR